MIVDLVLARLADSDEPARRELLGRLPPWLSRHPVVSLFLPADQQAGRLADVAAFLRRCRPV